jgi:hypothetical protein
VEISSKVQELATLDEEVLGVEHTPLLIVSLVTLLGLGTSGFGLVMAVDHVSAGRRAADWARSTGHRTR